VNAAVPSSSFLVAAVPVIVCFFSAEAELGLFSSPGVSADRVPETFFFSHRDAFLDGCHMFFLFGVVTRLLLFFFWPSRGGCRKGCGMAISFSFAVNDIRRHGRRFLLLFIAVVRKHPFLFTERRDHCRRPLFLFPSSRRCLFFGGWKTQGMLVTWVVCEGPSFFRRRRADTHVG